MKHATPQTLKKISSLLDKLRKLPLKEKKTGIFYHKTKAFLHFHEDNGDIYADVKTHDGDWERVKVSNQKSVIDLAKKYL